MALSVTGVEDIDKVLRGLPIELSDRLMKTAHADAAKPLISAAKSIVSVKTGNLRESIGVERVPIKVANEIGLVKVGPRRRNGYKGFHGHLVEFSHFTRDGVNKTEPKPFMEPAYERTKKQVEEGIANSVGKKVYAFMKRTIKNG